MKFLDFILLAKFWNWYDTVKEPWRFFICMILVYTPIFVLSSSISTNKLSQLIIGVYISYLSSSLFWKAFK